MVILSYDMLYINGMLQMCECHVSIYGIIFERNSCYLLVKMLIQFGTTTYVILLFVI